MSTRSQPSFSSRRRWKIGMDLFARMILVLAVIVMANYLGAKFPRQLYLSARTRVQLSSRTLDILNALTNHVAVTLYYDRQDDFYPDVVSLLNEYHRVNTNISVRTVDYLRNPGEAERVMEQYHLDSSADKNLIIFDAGDGRYKIASGQALVEYQPTGEVSKDKRLEFRAAAFNGQEMFTSYLLTLESNKRFKAYFLQGNGEASFKDSSNFGYMKFALVLAQNYIVPANLNLLETNSIPADCDLLIIAAPTIKLSESELQKIDDYLKQGGRLLALFNVRSINQPTGLEPILQRWGVNVGDDIVKDPNNTASGNVVVVDKFAHHPVVDALAGNNLSLQMIAPRPVSRINWQSPPPDAPQVTELAFSGPDSTLQENPGEPARSYPLMAAVEQKAVAGVANPHGNTRILVVGDSLFLGNFPIDYGGNHDFAGYAVNWLLDRTQLLKGIGARPITEFHLSMTKTQQLEVRWLLLGLLPGGVLLLGGMVWLARRK